MLLTTRYAAFNSFTDTSTEVQHSDTLDAVCWVLSCFILFIDKFEATERYCHYHIVCTLINPTFQNDLLSESSANKLIYNPSYCIYIGIYKIIKILMNFRLF